MLIVVPTAYGSLACLEIIFNPFPVSPPRLRLHQDSSGRPSERAAAGEAMASTAVQLLGFLLCFLGRFLFQLEPC